MATPVDQQETIDVLTLATASIRDAAAYGKKVAKDIDRIYFVACGAPNRSMLTLEYWLKHSSPTFEVQRYFPAEFMTINPPRLDERTLVILGSKSGTTAETVEAAKFIKDLPCKSVAVTQNPDKPLAKAVDAYFLSGSPPRDIVGLAHIATAIVLQALVGGLMAGKDGWPLEEKLLSSLEAMPEAVAHSKAGNESRATEEARLYHNEDTLYHIASGPMFNTAYVFGVCTLMEMQWLKSTPLEGAEFFHGPFEIVDQNSTLFLYLGEDPSRPLMERAVTFCQKYTEKLVVYDSKDFAMPGIDPEIRAIVAPFIVGAALDRIGEKLAVWNNHPLETRRYMWKTEY